MKLKCLSCDALTRAVYWCAAQSPHVVDVELFELGLHRNPVDLRLRLQTRIDAVSGTGYDAIVLGYGLCGKATEGLRARTLPLVIPRAHDCITLFLGSRQRYAVEFERCPGTYWYSQDYLERNTDAGIALSLGAAGVNDITAEYETYVKKYGRDNAEYLMEVMSAWKQHYQRAVFIDLGISDGTIVEQQARDDAARRGWTYERMAGDLCLMQQLLSGAWTSDMLVIEPGRQITMTCNEDVLGSQDSLRILGAQ